MGWCWVASCRNPGQPGPRFPKRRTRSPRLIWLRRPLDEKPTSERRGTPPAFIVPHQSSSTGLSTWRAAVGAICKHSLCAQCQQRSRVLAQALSLLNSAARRRHERFLLVRYRAVTRERRIVAPSSCIVCSGCTTERTCRKTGVPVKSTVFFRRMVCEVAWGGGREGGGSETHCISAILNISSYVLQEIHRDAMDKMDDFFRWSK